MKGLIGLEAIFRGFIVKYWTGDGNETKFEKYNRVIAMNCVEMYFQCWTDRNEKFNEPEEQMRSLQICADKIRNKVESQSGYAKIFYEAHPLKENTKDIQYLKNLIRTIREIMNKQKSIIEIIDIRKYFAIMS